MNHPDDVAPGAFGAASGTEPVDPPVGTEDAVVPATAEEPVSQAAAADPAPHTEVETSVPDVPGEEADEPEDEPDPATLVVASLSRIEERLTESQRLVERQADVAAKLHAENQVLRAGELRAAQGSLVISVLRVFDDVRQMAATSEDPGNRRDLEIVADALADALARIGVEPVIVEPGDRFTPAQHKIAGIETTDDEGADRTVARIVRPGFAWPDGTTVRVTDVAVFKFTAPRVDPGVVAEDASPSASPAPSVEH